MKTACLGPPETKRCNLLGIRLELDLNDALRGKHIDGDITKSFLEFLVVAGNKENLVEVAKDMYLTHKTGHIDNGLGVMFNEGITNAISYNEMISSIQTYLRNENYFEFIEKCRRTAKNVIKFPKVRLNFNSNFLKNAVEAYQDFLRYMEEKADNDEVDRKKRAEDLW